MSEMKEIIAMLCGSDRVRVHPPTGLPILPDGVKPPAELLDFYSLCGGVDFLDHQDRSYVRYRILQPRKVVDIGTATCAEAATEPPLNAWFVVGEDDNGEHVAIDLEPSRSGQCYDVFHETFEDPTSARIVAGTFAGFIDKLFARGKSFWFDEGFVSHYFDGSPRGG